MNFKGTLLLLVGFVLFLPSLLALTVIIAVAREFHRVPEIGPTVAAAAGVAAGAWLFRRGASMRLTARKMNAIDGRALLQRDPRPPILYLRSFLDDEKLDMGREPSADGAIGSAMSSAVNVLIGSAEGARLTQEEELTKVLSRFGPVVAVGDPSEELPDLGAARMYFDNTWQEQVSTLMRRSLLVVFRVGANTPGFWWEVDRVLKLLPPERLVFWIPATSESLDNPMRIYEQFSARFEQQVPCKLPAWRKRATFLRFDKAWAAAHLVRQSGWRPRPGAAMVKELIPR